VRPNGFVARSSSLLFAIFRPGDAYLIGIFEHGDWALTRLVEIAVRNWPEANLFAQSRTAIGLTARFDDDDRLELRESGLTMMLEVDGRVYSPPGQSLAGTPLAAGRHTDTIEWTLERIRESVDDELAAFEAKHPDLVDAPEKWVAYVWDDQYGLRNADTVWKIGDLVPGAA
jgi:hypothetical protein